jgi:hypothetical protein
MKAGDRLIGISINHPRLVTIIMMLVTVILGAMILQVQVDTNPENMLAEDEAVRIFHNQVKKDFTLHDMVVLGIVNDRHPDGVFNPATLKRVQQLTEFVGTLSDHGDPDKRIISRDIIAPANVEIIKQDGPGQIRFEWLMKEAPATEAEALAIRDYAMANPLLKGTMVSEDGKAIAIYLPLGSREFAHEVRVRLLEKIETFTGDEEYHITGLPVAESTFGVEMFVQMAISAPLAMLAIFILMLIFFKKVQLIIAPMIVAIVTVICTMGLLSGTGHTLHIMSSMIPIFLMPIAVVDSIHIISEFFDAYPRFRDRRKALIHVMKELFVPMLFTSLTSAAGFASLILAPIPPVQTFGMFVAFGILLAWLLTIVFVPAYIMMMKEESLVGLGMINKKGGKDTTEATTHGYGLISRSLHHLGTFTYSHAKLIVSLTVVVIIVSVYGISKIEVNDNPVKWFNEKHSIRVADKVLNRHFGGTYEAFLILSGQEVILSSTDLDRMLRAKINSLDIETEFVAVRDNALAISAEIAARQADPLVFLGELGKGWDAERDIATDEAYYIWDDFRDELFALKNRDQIFKQPEVLRYIVKLQEHLQKTGVVGKSNSVADLIKKVHQELFEGQAEYFRIPEHVNGVAQTLISFQNSHHPDDLFHFVTPDYKRANIMLQLQSGDNQDMERVISEVADFFVANPPPVALEHNWAGLSYINVVWQDKMVMGMRDAFLGSFVVVLIMMSILFRSPLWGLLAMVPLSVTIAVIYGIIGLVGKDYDMPVAVLSSLTLGLAVDFAIHFLERSRKIYDRVQSWPGTLTRLFAEPARAISRNVIVVAVGFTPLLASTLVPYQTVGIFLASIMVISGVATLLILPALITIFAPFLFRNRLPS